MQSGCLSRTAGADCIAEWQACFLEKPAALCLEDLEDMIDVAEKHRDLTAMVGYVRRYADPFRKLKQLLAEDPRPVEYLRCRTLVCEAPFYLNKHEEFSEGRYFTRNDF